MLFEGVRDGGSIEDSSYYPTTTFGYEKLDDAWLNSYALVSANNGQGGQVEYGYDEAEVEIHPCAIAEFVGTRPGEGYRFYVEAITTTDGIGVAARREMNVSGGWAQGGRFNDAGLPSSDCAERFEFTGYESVTTTQQSQAGAPLQVVVTRFHQKYEVWNEEWLEWFASPKAGMSFETRLYDPTPYLTNPGLLQIMATTWLSSTEHDQDWVYKSQEVQTTLDPISPAHSIVLTTMYAYEDDNVHQNYEQYGNVTHIREYDVNGLFRTSDFFYTPYVTTTNYIVNKPRNQRVWAGVPGIAQCVSHTVMVYDHQAWPLAPTKGDLTGVAVATNEGMAENGCDGGYLSSAYRYDVYGNQIVMTDTRGYVTYSAYDTDTAGYPSLFGV